MSFGQIEQRTWLVHASHFITDTMLEARSVEGKLSSTSIVALSAIIAEVAARHPRYWASMQCDDLLYRINAEQAILPEHLKGFRNRLLALIKELGGICISTGRWESKAMKPTEARPLQKKLSAILALHGMEASVENFDNFAILSVHSANPYTPFNSRMFLSALHTVQASVKYNVD